MIIDILGTPYLIEYKAYKDDLSFEQGSLSGYCETRLKKIVICLISTRPDFDGRGETSQIVEKETLRHEILHAFLIESGLDASSSENIGPWARNEEMVDWFALQGPKIIKAWQEADAL